MKFYIAYKYSKIADKESLKSHLLKIAEVLAEKGNTTFMLGRDVQNWDNTTHSLSSKIKVMLGEVKSSDEIFAYVTTSDRSSGLMIEFHMAKLLGKKITLAIQKDVNEKYLRSLATTVIEFETFDELIQKLHESR